MSDQGVETSNEQNDLPREDIQARKRQARLNALVLVAVLLLGAILPPPYQVLAPFLFVIPLIIALAARIRQARSRFNPLPYGSVARDTPPVQNAGTVEPYSFTPKDPKDPRRYKPIG